MDDIDDGQPHLTNFAERITTEATGKCLISTNEEYIGLAPSYAKPEDIICIFLRWVSPIILRPAENGKFKLDREVFVYRFSDSVALLGPLPENFHALFSYNESRKDCRWAYHNKIDDTTSEEEPRLNSLGISSETDKNGGPRLIVAEQLSVAGVGIHYFDLI